MSWALRGANTHSVAAERISSRSLRVDLDFISFILQYYKSGQLIKITYRLEGWVIQLSPFGIGRTHKSRYHS